LGPSGVEDFKKNYSQQLRKDRYEAVLQQLVAQNAVFACTCTRAQIKAVSPSGVYLGTCHSKQLPLDTHDAVWRIRVGELGEVEEFIVRKKDGWPSYHLASVIDDEDYGINLIVRGEDLVESTACQRYLAQHIKATQFMGASIVHHPLIGSKDHKMSKSAGDTSLMAMKEQGYLPSDIYKMLAFWLQLPQKQINSLQELLDIFSIRYIPPRSMSFEELTQIVA
jgi:glutamyl-tRNA synthetase